MCTRDTLARLTWVVFGDKNNGSRSGAELRKILLLAVASSSVCSGVPKRAREAEEAPGAALSLAVSLRGSAVYFCSWSAAGSGAHTLGSAVPVAALCWALLGSVLLTG